MERKPVPDFCENWLVQRRILSHSMNSHEPAGEERAGGFGGRFGGAELGDNHKVGVYVLKG